jgi:hypothetical protein
MTVEKFPNPPDGVGEAQIWQSLDALAEAFLAEFDGGSRHDALDQVRCVCEVWHSERIKGLE